MSDYRLQVIHVKRPHEVVHGWQPGDRVETDMVEELCARLEIKGVGWFHTNKQVLASVREAWAEMLLDFKGRV